MRTKILFILLLVAFICPSVLSAQYALTPMTNPDPNKNNLSSIWGLDNNNIFAGGGVFLKYNGSSWTQIPISFTAGISSIYGTSSNNVWLACAEGYLAHYDGSAVTKVDIGNYEILQKIFGFSENDIYLCGRKGKVWHYNGTNWSSIPNTLNNFNFMSMWGVSGSDLYLCGYDNYAPYTSRLIHYNGSIFTELKNFSSNGLTRISSSDNNTFYMVGGDGLWTYNKASDNLSSSFSGSLMDGIYVFNSGSVLLAPTDSILFYNGSTWNGCSNYGSVYSIYSPGDNPNNVFMVGAQGRIFHLDLTSGVAETSIPTRFNVYPNPASEQITIDLAFKNKINTKIELFNLVGQQVKLISEFGGNELQTTVNVGDIPSGSYVIKFTTDEGRSFSKKLIIAK